MGLFANIFGKKQEVVEQAVLIYIKLSNDEFGTDKERQRIIEIEDKLKRAINDNELGEFDGNEFGEGECVFYMYGPDAEKLFQIVYPILKREMLPEGSYIIKRFGPPGAPQETFDL